MSDKLEMLEALLRQHPQITYATRHSANYSALREAYIIDSPAIPLAIARPQTVEDVATLVSYAVSQGVDLSVRSGGHDLFGRYFASGALAIDMRDIAFVDVADDHRSATVGGGILATHLAGELGRHMLATAIGSAPTVGWVGWATHGGYGPFVANYGLGVDQILSATVVNCNGETVQADETMLEAIRGGGGCIGVIADITIKVYPLDQVLGGVIVFKTEDFAATLRRFTAGYQDFAAKDLPDALGIQQSFVNTPMGKVFAAIFVWSSNDLELGHHWLRQIEGLGEVIHSSVAPKTIKNWLDDSGAFMPKSAYGGNCTISIWAFTEEVIKTVGEQIAKMPADSATLFSAHQVRGKSASPQTGSIFGARTPHFVLEFVATSSSRDIAQEAWKWANGFRETVKKTAADSIASFTYISLTPPSDADFSAIYGSYWQRLVEIKKQHDPKNIFRHAVPQFEFSD